MDERIKQSHLIRIKEIFRENFLRELTDEEAENYFQEMYGQTEEQLVKLGFDKKAIERYLSGKLEMVFSPNAVNAEILRVISRIGIDALEASSKYKRMGEMVDATCLALALKKMGQGEWMIKAQDYPDILLIQPNPDHDVREKPFRAVSLEIMQIPEIQKAKFGSDIEAEVAKFIQEKKFSKRYEGIPHLLIHLNFEHIGFDMRRLSAEICKFPAGPFHRILIRVNADPESKVMKIVQVYPSYSEMEIDFVNDADLRY